MYCWSMINDIEASSNPQTQIEGKLADTKIPCIDA